MKVLLVLLAALLLSQQTEAKFKKLYKHTKRFWDGNNNENGGEPLILTPYLREGRIEEAQQAALVDNSTFSGVTSYAGYFTVNDRFDSNMWFWFFPSADNCEEDPVVLWLNGGIIDSVSMTGVFYELGPFIFNEDGSLSLREYSWHRNQSLLFIDTPIGAGFSFTNDDDGFATSATEVGEDTYAALTQFSQLFPKLQKNDFFIGGNFLAGKYLSAIGHIILKRNPSAELKLNLQGILIGNGWTDPVNQLNYGPFLYNLGLVSATVRDQINEHRDEVIEAIKAGNYPAAASNLFTLFLIIEDQSDVNIYNYLESSEQQRRNINEENALSNFVTTDEIRRALHAGSTNFRDIATVLFLMEDVCQSVAPLLEELLENYRVLIYTGQLNIICGHPVVLDYLKKLNFTGAEALRNSSRNIWRVDDEPAGSVRLGGNLVELLVKDAGYFVARDQPKRAYDMLYRFTRNQTFA